MKTLAIFSPSQNAYSETFIQAHRKLPFDVRFYFDGHLPSSLEEKSMMQLPCKLRFQKKLLKGFSNAEKKLIFSLKNEKVDVVLAEYGPTAAESLRVLQYLKLPLVVHFHGYDASMRTITEAYKNSYPEVFRYASTVVAVSNAMSRDLVSLGCPPQKIVLNTYGPSETFFEINATHEQPQFIAIGRFVDKKAPHLTILAFRKVVEQHPEARLKMIGDGPLWHVCKDLVNHLGLDGSITFLGVQPPSQIRAELENSLAFVQHSVIAANGDSEGTPVAVLEAQAAALPVISTDHAGIPDVVLHEQTGLLSDEHDIETMADNMVRMIQEKKLAAKMGLAGRKRIKENFSMERHMSVLEREINKALG